MGALRAFIPGLFKLVQLKCHGALAIKSRTLISPYF